MLAICGLQYFPLIWRFVAAKWLSILLALSAPLLTLLASSLFYVWQFAGTFMICSIVSAAFGVANRCIFNATLKSHLHWGAPSLFMLCPRFSPHFPAFPPLCLCTVCAESENFRFVPHSSTCGHSICCCCNQSHSKFNSSREKPLHLFFLHKEKSFVCVSVCLH